MPEFRSLADLLRGEYATLPSCAELVQAAQESVPAARDFEGQDYLREVRLFKAHLSEVLDRGLECLLAGVAREILARELLLAPADVRTLADAALKTHMQSMPLRVRVHRDDAGSFADFDVPVFSDESLERGDAYLDLRNGSIDLTLAVRAQDLILKVART